MLETLDPVEIFIFDLHLRPGGVANPGATFRPGFTFLGEPAEYDARYAVKAPVAGAPQLRPIGRRRLTQRNLFWATYRQLDPFTPTPWQLFLPLAWEDPALQVRLVVPELGVDLPVTVKALVWATGWSTSIELRLPGPVSLEKATALVGVLRAGPERTPFVVGGTAEAASQLFLRVKKRIASTLLLDTGGGGPTLPARYVVAVADAARARARYKALSTLQQQAVHQFLFGRAEPALQAAVKNQGKLSRFAHDDFGITHPDHGTVLCLTELAADPAFAESGFHCLAANVRTAWVQMLMLAKFVEQAAAKAQDPRVGPVLAAARSLLKQASSGNASHYFTGELCSSHPTILNAVNAAVPGANPPSGAAAGTP